MHDNGEHASLENEKSFKLEQDFSKVSPELRQAIFSTWSDLIAGSGAEQATPATSAEFAAKMNALVDNELEGHLETLARQQGKELRPLPELRAESTPEEQLDFLRQLTARINAVWNENNAGITPRLSRELNGMDCSMSTWVMRHELAKTGLKFEWGAPTGHSIGMVTLSNGETYYADGQGGFVEQVEVESRPIAGDVKVLEIKNWQEIQSRHQTFFPRYVFSSPDMGIVLTLGNLNSMLYEQHLEKVTDAEKIQYSEDARIVEQLQPYAQGYQERLRPLASGKKDDAGRDISPPNELSARLFPAIEKMYESPEFTEDTERLRRK